MSAIYPICLSRTEGLEPSRDALARTVDDALQCGLLVVGALGRAVIFNQLVGDPLYELHARTPAEGALRRERSFPVARGVDVIGQEVVDGNAGQWAPHHMDSTTFIIKAEEYSKTRMHSG